MNMRFGLHVGSFQWPGSPAGVLACKEKNYAEWFEYVNQYTQRKLDVLQGHCETFGRPYNEIEKSIVTYIKVGSDGMTSEEVLQLCHDFADIGFQYVIFVISNCHEIEPLALLGREVIPSVSELT